mmetsp:Transcript_10087/g.27718  ORF Transcript_10087/g.27718 Transcript_10087/m.27718 type:complete len:271 (-) Transcript_10087:229-1041(-)
MSSTYERVKENSAEFWEFDRVSLIREYKDNKDPLPPPFNVLWYLYIGLRWMCGQRESPFSRGFKWPRRRQGAADVFKIGDAARREYLNTEAKELAAAVEHQVELLHRGQRVLEAEQRSQFEAITGRIEAIKNDVHAIRHVSNPARQPEASSSIPAGPTRLAAIPFRPDASEAKTILHPAPLTSQGYGFSGPRPELHHRQAPTPTGSSSSLQQGGPAAPPQAYQMPLHEVARAALASLPPVSPLPQPQRLPRPEGVRDAGHLPPRSPGPEQ